MNWKKRKRLTRLIHKHELDKHSDYKEWVKEWCIVSGYYEKSRYQLLKEWKGISDDEYIEKVSAAINHYILAKLRMMTIMGEFDPTDEELDNFTDDDFNLFDEIYEAVDKVREETAKVKPLPLHLRSIEEFTEFMSNLPPYVPPSEEEWNEGMKRAEAFHRAFNVEE